MESTMTIQSRKSACRLENQESYIVEINTDKKVKIIEKYPNSVNLNFVVEEEDEE